MVFKWAKEEKVEQNQNRDFHRHVPFSRSYTEIESTWLTAKYPWRKSFGTWYYIVTCTTLCVTFSSKSKAINVFPKHILKWKACDQSNQGRKKLFCHVIVKNYLSNASWQFLIKSKVRRGAKSKNRHPSWLYYTVVGLSDAATRGVV